MRWLVVFLLLVPGQAWAGKDFDNAGDSITYSNVQDPGASAQSIHCWLKSEMITSTPEKDALLIIHDTTPSDAVQFRYGQTGTDGDEALQFRVSYSSTTLTVIATKIGQTNPVSVNTWQSIVETWDGSTTATNVHFYVDNAEQDYATQTDGAGTAPSTDGNWIMADNNGSTRDLDGSLAEFAWWSRVITADERAALADGFIPLFISNGLEFYVHLTNENDDLASGQDGVENGNPTFEENAFSMYRPTGTYY